LKKGALQPFPPSLNLPAGGAMTEEQWIEYLKETRGWAIRMGFDLLHSRAYRELNYGPAIKSLNWFYEKLKVEVDKRKHGKNRYKIRDGDISFTYREAGFRGLSFQQFSRTLKELHKFGFIEIKKPGSALRGDWTQFRFSERWKEYGTPNFKYLECPKSVHWINFGFGAKRKGQRKS
jgi:hypothetical protein